MADSAGQSGEVPYLDIENRYILAGLSAAQPR
jgi:hypothetical protein